MATTTALPSDASTGAAIIPLIQPLPCSSGYAANPTTNATRMRPYILPKYPFTPTSTTLHAVCYAIFSFPVKQRWPQRVLAYSITATASTSGFYLDEETGVYERGDLDHRGCRVRLLEVASEPLCRALAGGPLKRANQSRRADSR